MPNKPKLVHIFDIIHEICGVCLVISQKNKKQNVSINDYSIEEIILNARELASEQNGCRLLQKQIELHPEYGNELFDSLENDLLTLSCGSFGNYLLQKLICVISLERINRFV